MSENTDKQSNKQLILKLLGITVGMFAFGYALVPLYNVFCDITGINGKVQSQALYKDVKENKNRQVKVEFLSNINSGMPWEFKPMVRSVMVHPGELKEVHFYARNLSHKTVVGQSVPSISPNEASLYIHKTECFCFSQQTLKGGEEIEMAVKFFLDDELPEDITQMTVSYQLFNVTESVTASGAK